MGVEVLYIPEPRLQEVIDILRLGMEAMGDRLTNETKAALETWCDEEEDYLKHLAED